MDQTFDKMYFSKSKALAGIDEVGVTAIAGPIVAACVVLPRLTPKDDLSLFLVDDSKKTIEKYRYKNAQIIKSNALAYGIGRVSPVEIDALDIFVASNLAMKRALLNCLKRFGPHSVDFCLVDGNRKIDLERPHDLIVKGDAKSLSIAAASVLAKVHRDEIMKAYEKKNPCYGFDKHKGYSCERHFEGLDEKGIWPGVHRSSMYPIAKKKNADPKLKKRRRSWINKTQELLYLEDRNDRVSSDFTDNAWFH